MKTTQRRIAFGGLTIIEVLVIVAILFILAGLLLPALSGSTRRSPRIACVNNLKQIGVGLRMWSKEGSERYPWQVSTNIGGTGELLVPTDAYQHFRAVSNDLGSPKILACPSDLARSRVARWEDFTGNHHLSYFVGLDADETRPQTILSGDRNLATNGKLASGLLTLTAAAPVEWSKETHNRQGNFGLGDGSVQQLTTLGMSKQIEAAIASETNRTTIRLLIP